MGKKPIASVDACKLNKDVLRKIPNPATIVIFGASGDLTERKLIPSLFRLDCDGLLPEKLAVVGVARTEMDSEGFRKKLAESIEIYSRHSKDRICKWSKFEKKLIYHRADYDNLEDYKTLNRLLVDLGKKQDIGANCLFYLSTPPILYPVIVSKLGEAGMAQQSDEYWRRIIIEKPFGRDLASAIDLNNHVHQVFDESQVYRIDHYLGKETVQNLLVFRFGNAIFEPLWSRNYIDHVQITVSEEVGLGNRAGYYDTAGILRDMFQNHLLQLLTLTAMEPPAGFNATSLRDEKVKVLKAVRPIKPEEVAKYTVRAQYRTYRDEKGVARGTETATFAVLKLFIDNWRWRNVPFYLRSGKALNSKVTEISIQFRHVPHLMFPLPPEEQLPPNKLVLCLQPNEGMRLGFETKLPGAGMKTRTVSMDFLYEQDFGENILPDAYERLILDALQGDASLFTRSDEIELAWKIIDPIIQGWESEYAPPLAFYELGTCGPSKADEFIKADDRKWNPCI
ncbi:MAG: glucose-6-phosphate dehydrogenase [Planctomycetia bacterium]|jgi:glucose-6-phosphate 1-dehydrogenase|uniref:glucose-6-phosphate dehydrogenase n=1 Tax=Candidatus Kuenenia sp. TaxID=2499824 RepID=UPI001D223233|nr:glucose-6-phosphate dehydrogenase [Candidatus Kuenenia sp.]MBE7546223.1 glucose-6-phosphate dehydrogenase [Planctomycetia bacterium]MCZ7623524.1 glucose-6-phosphate dehydrogenase [Candidatus Kuenenia sp.]TVM01569.1 MAG: glucose-6-phosphate dehydrogenase [Candidatus Kuenenia stuttgartiensis]